MVSYVVSSIVSAIAGAVIRHFSPAAWELVKTKAKAAWAAYRAKK